MNLASLETPSTNRASARRDRVLTIGVAAVAGLLVWVVARLVLGHDLSATQGDSDTATGVGPVAVVVTSVVAGLIGWGVLALLERFTGQPGRNWLVLGIVVLLLSLSGPLTQANGVGTTVALLIEHVVVGGVLIVGLLRTVPIRRT